MDELTRFSKAINKVLQEMADIQAVFNEFFYQTLSDENKKLLIEKMKDHKKKINKVPDLDELKKMIKRQVKR